MDKKNFNFFNKILTMVVLALVFLFSGVTLSLNKNLFASEITPFTDFNNGDFTSKNDTKQPASPSSWTLSGSVPSNVKTGIISLDETVFEENKEDNYNLATSPTKYANITSSDSNILMINARTGKANLGYKSSSFTLKNNAYYTINVWAYTETTNNSFGTVALTGSDALNSKIHSFEVATNGNWQEYSFFIKTNSISNLTCSLELWLGHYAGSQTTGASGAIFFDNVTINELSEKAYNDLYGSINQTSTKNLEINLQNNKENLITNANFEEDNLVGWSPITNNETNFEDENLIAGSYYIDNVDANYVENVLKINKAPTNGNMYKNSKALLLNSLENAESFGYESDSFILEENTKYKLSVWTKGEISTGKAQIALIEQPFKENDEYYKNFNEKLNTFTLDVSTFATNEKTNNWVEHSFYVSTRTFTPILDADYKFELKLQLLLGTKENPAKGYVLFDNIQIEKISSENYSAGITNSNSKEANFLAKSTSLITDSGFNAIKVENTNNSYPYAPENWKLTSKNSEEFYLLNGIINTNPNKFTQFKNSVTNNITNSNVDALASSVINPIISTTYPENNILMIGNLSNNYQLYESEEIKLSANSYYILSVNVYTYNLNNATAGLRLVNSNDVTIGEILKIDSNNEWKTYSLYIQTGSEEVKANLQLSLGADSEGKGFAFFDNAVITTSNEETYKNPTSSAVNYAEYRKVNLKVEDFSNTSYIKDANTGLYTPNGWTFETEETDLSELNYGVIDISKNNEFSTPTAYANNNLLVLTAFNSDNYLSYVSKKSYKINENSYYKISVFIRTTDIAYNSDKDGQYGASFLVTSDNKEFKGFKGINTNGEWKEYSIFVNSSDETSFTIYLSLGNEDNQVHGNAYFSTLLFNSIEDSDYVDGVSVLEEDETIDNIMAIGNTDIAIEDDNEDADDEEKSGFNFDFALVSSIITAVAIIIALVGFGIRKINYKKPVKIGKGDYDRTVMLKKVKEQEEKISANNRKLNELRKQLEDIKKEIDKAKYSYKQEVVSIDESFKKEIKQIESGNIKDELKDIETLKEEAKLAKQQHKLEKREAYELRRKALINEYNLIEKQIELLYQEELELIKEYKMYRKQVKMKKLEIKQNKQASK